MKRFKVLGLTLLAVFALGSVLSATAFALPELLGWEGAASWTGKNTAPEPRLESESATITCTAATASGTQETDLKSSFDIHFTGCKVVTGIGSFGCNTKGDAKEVILSKGTADNVWDVTQSDTAGVLFLPEPVTIECTALVKIKVEGHLVCLWKEPLVSAKTKEFVCSGSAAKQSETSYLNDERKPVTGQFLTSSLNGGAATPAAEVASGSTTFTNAVAFMNE